MERKILKGEADAAGGEQDVGFVFSPLIGQDSNLIPIPTNAFLCVEVSLVWKKDAYLFCSIKTFKEYVKTTELFFINP